MCLFVCVFLCVWLCVCGFAFLCFCVSLSVFKWVCVFVCVFVLL